MDKKVFKCLVASPSDTATERKICEKVFEEINAGIGDAYGFVIEKRMWEHNTRPGFGEYSQAVVSEQLGDDYDVFIGIMYKRFGTETKVSGSGTEEEFNNAYKRVLDKEKVEIMFYFNDEPSKMSDIVFEEVQKIQAFRKKVNDLGGYFWLYDGPTQFEKIFRTQLSDFFIKFYKGDKSSSKNDLKNEIIKTKLDERFESSLRAFTSQPIIWVEPVLSNTSEISQNADENYTKRIKVDELLINTESTFIRAPAQFGLTSLAHYLVKLAWEKGKFFLYIDCEKVKAHNIHKAVVREAEAFGLSTSDIDVIILDSWNNFEIESFKKLKNLCDAYVDIPVIVMHTIDDSRFLKEQNDVQIKRDFTNLHLLALPRNQIRKVVSEYNKAKGIGIEEKVLAKVISDLDILNIHRTPMNCLTLLKVSEKHFDESPVNRTNMLEMVLFILFNLDEIPTYKSKPDLKDCEFVLGRFCEDMIRRDFYTFTREAFIHQLKSFCSEKLIELDIDIVFDVLKANSIIVKKEVDFAFRASYWIYYFAAKRMHNNTEFAQYIFTSKKYIAFPEIIEFYTGIDRNRQDALEILTRDIRATCDIVSSKVRLSENMNPFELIKWEPTAEQIKSVQEELSDSVKSSGLPDEIKDRHADKAYNQIRPYNQSIQSFFEQYSLHNLIQNIKASSRALRNSDYVTPDAKRALLREILRSWEQISHVLLALTPILADKGQADFEGHGFVLSSDFGDTYEKRVKMIIQVNLTNVVGYFKDDIYSNKIAPLLFEHFTQEEDRNKKHQLALLFVFMRPRGWKNHIEQYLISLPKNSFYLYNIYNSLRARYRYDFADEIELNELSYLIKMCFAKHQSGSKKPGIHEIAKVRINKLERRTDADE